MLVSTLLLLQALGKLRDEEKRYMKAYGSRIIEFNQFEESMKDIKSKKQALESQIKINAEKSPDDIVSLDGFESVCDTIYYSIKHSVASEKQEYIRNLIVSIYVEERRKALVNGRIPISVQAQNVGYESISRHCWVTKRRKIYSF